MHPYNVPIDAILNFFKKRKIFYVQNSSTWTSFLWEKFPSVECPNRYNFGKYIYELKMGNFYDFEVHRTIFLKLRTHEPQYVFYEFWRKKDANLSKIIQFSVWNLSISALRNICSTVHFTYARISKFSKFSSDWKIFRSIRKEFHLQIQIHMFLK